MNVFDIRTFPHNGTRFTATRDKVAQLVDYARAAGKSLAEVKVYPGDYNALRNAINRSQREAAKRSAKAAAGDPGKPVVAPVLVDALRFGDVAVVAGNHNSRLRPVQK